jgi:hypothetical protein
MLAFFRFKSEIICQAQHKVAPRRHENWCDKNDEKEYCATLRLFD